MLAHIEKIVLLFYLPRLRRWTFDTGCFTNSKFAFFWKGKQVYTRLFGLPPSGRGRHAIYLPKYKWEENVFFLIINLRTVIQWVNKACRCFKNWNNPTQVFFYSINFLITEGHTIRFYFDGRVESTIMKKKKYYVKCHIFKW